MIELRNSKTTYLGAVAGKDRWSLDASIGAIQFRENGGEWQDIDPSIEAADTDGFSLKFTKVPYLGRIANDSRRRIYPDRTNLDCWIEFQKPFASMPAPSRKDRWFYWDFPTATMGVRFDNSSIKFGFRLKTASAPTSITIPFTTQGITRQGRLLYHDGELIGELRKPTATDANLKERECDVTFGTGEVTVSLDTTDLAFPIEIDPTLDLQVGAGEDDADEREYLGAIDLTSTVHHASSTTYVSRYWGAHRWVLGETKPVQGDTIIAAYAELYLASTASDDINGNWHFEKVASPAQFTTTAYDITNRTRTTSSCSDIRDSVLTGAAGFYRFPAVSDNLVDELQEVVDSFSPTALALIFRPNQNSTKNLISQPYDTDSSYGAKLHIEWETSSVDYPISITCGLSAASSLSRLFASDRGISSNLSLSTSISRALAWARATSSNLKVSLAQLYEYYSSGDLGTVSVDGADWKAQTFTPSVAHRITSVKLLLWREGSPGTFTVGIRATDGSGHPTGADLCSGSIDGDALTTNTAGEWKVVHFDSGCNVLTTKYGMVARAPDGDGLNCVHWMVDASSPTYSGGNYEYSDDSGSSWTANANADLMFEEWGDGISRTTAYSRASSSNLSATATISRALAWTRASLSNLSLTTTISRAVVWARGITAGLTTAVSVLVSGITNYLIEITANLSAAVSVARGFAVSRATSSGLTVAATIAKSWGRTISSSVGLTVGTTISRLAKWTRGTSSALSVVATVARSFARTITSSVSLTASATVSRLFASTRSSTSNLALSTSISKFRGWVISTSSSLGLTVSISRLVGFARATSSSLAVSVSVAIGTAAHYLVTIATNLSVGVNVARTWASARATSSSLSLSTSVSRVLGRTITTVANLSLTTTISRLATWARSSSSGLTLAVSVLRSWARTITTSTGLNLMASVSRAVAWGRNTTSNLSLSVSLARSWGRTIVTSVGLTLATSVTRSVDWIRATTSNLGLSVSIIVAGITNYLIELTTNLSVTATVVRSWAATRATSSALSVATSISRIMAWVVATTSNLNLAVTVDRITSYIRATSSGLTVSPTISRTLAYARGITSNLSLAVTINRATEYLVTITANLRVSAIIRVFPRIKSLIFRVMHTFTGRTVRDDYDAFRDIKDDHDQFRPVK